MDRTKNALTGTEKILMKIATAMDEEFQKKYGKNIRAMFYGTRNKKWEGWNINEATISIITYLNSHPEYAESQFSSIHKIRENEPWGNENFYFSYRKECGVRTNKLSYSAIYRKFQTFVTYYKDRLQRKVTLDEFVDYALDADYIPGKQMKVTPCFADAVTLQDVSFIDTGVRDELVRILDAYRSIPARSQRYFGCVRTFVKWSVRNGFNLYTDFAKVDDETQAWTLDNCKWDIFDLQKKEAHLQMERETTPKQKYATGAENWYNTKRNKKISGGIEGKLADLSYCKKWYEKNLAGSNRCARRIDKSKPWSEENIVIVYKAA